MYPNLARELIKTRKAVKQKYLSLKSDTAQTQTQIEKRLKPLVDPLKQLLHKVEPLQTQFEFKTEFPTNTYSSPKKTEYKPFQQYLPTTNISFLEDTYSTIPQDVSIDEDDNTHDVTILDRENQTLDDDLEKTRQEILDLTTTPMYDDYLQNFDPLPREYVDDSIRGDEEKFDRHYGLSHNLKTEKFTLGNTEVEIIGPDIKVNNIKYKGTPGLYELLFKKEPIGYNQKDLDEYMDILKRTNAYRRNFDSDAQIQGTSLLKYRNIIRPYLIKHKILKEKDIGSYQPSFSLPKPPSTRPPSRRTQLIKNVRGGMIELSNKPIDYIYYDNINEIVDRLRLLVASTSSGNNSHSLEINSIIEELKEAKIIK